MHDLHEADKITKLILEYAKKNNLKNVKSATVELGSVIEHGEEITPENLVFNIKMLAEGTIAEGLDVKIGKIKTDSWNLKEIEGDKN
ncbi:MAG: hydrogenase/urease maturation nickel metallochaperone HypA [Patescibacteria group bacterium]|nr:hypothetical protein [Patescibacteria group bacterium]